jgi:hypothetical protein
MYYLNWISNSWDTPEIFRNVPQRIGFNTLEKLINVMSKHIYSGEWVTDNKGNRVNIDWNDICIN